MGSDPLPDLITSVYDAAADAARWPLALRTLERTLGTAAVMLFRRRPSRRDPGSVVAPSLNPALLRRYEAGDFARDPFDAHWERLPLGRLVLGETCVPCAVLRASSFFRDWMAPQGLASDGILLAALARDSDHGTAGLQVYPRAGRQPIEGPRVERLLPHLGRALAIQRRTLHLEAELGALAHVVDGLAVALILVDRTGRAHAANRAARRLLEDADGLSLQGGTLRAGARSETAELKRLICEGKGEDRRPDALLVPRSSGRRPLEALVVRLASPGAALDVADPMTAILVTDPDAPAVTPAEPLCCWFGLTPAEAALARRLARGLDLREAARALGITRETARSRLKQIFVKTHTSRQAELVRLVLSSPIQLEAER